MHRKHGVKNDERYHNTLSSEELERILNRADRFGVKPEELDGVGTGGLLNLPKEELLPIADYVFKKNAGLYWRLS